MTSSNDKWGQINVLSNEGQVIKEYKLDAKGKLVKDLPINPLLRRPEVALPASPIADGGEYSDESQDDAGPDTFMGIEIAKIHQTRERIRLIEQLFPCRAIALQERPENIPSPIQFNEDIEQNTEALNGNIVQENPLIQQQTTEITASIFDGDYFDPEKVWYQFKMTPQDEQ